ncbi:MAG TPA: hypothetical protein VN228_02015, partial [Pyrinomonadaceae bacterium]|nr:hypothetical protein [Pyrinomonadaceae bacterium]
AQARRAEPDRPFEELLPADGYGVYAELRRVGTLFEMGEMKMAMGAVRLIDADMAGLVEIAEFVNLHAELLADARLVVAGLATRRGLPSGLVALHLATPEAAAGFEPKYRAFLNNTAKQFNVAQPPPPRARRRQAAKPKPAAARLQVKRAGSWLIASDKPFTPARLRRAGEASLAESARFQSLRGRFASEQFFLYFETERAQEGWMLSAIQEQEERATARAAAPEAAPPLMTAETAPQVAPEAGPVAETRVVGESAVVAPSVAEPPASSAQAGERGEEEAAAREMEAAAAAAGEPEAAAADVPAEPARPTEEQLAARRLDGLMRNLWGGVPKWPGAVAAAVGLEGGTVALRVAVENRPDSALSLLPFLPNVISGAPVASDAAQVAPADGDVFFSASLDWGRIFDAMMGAARQRVGAADPAMPADAGVLAEEAGLGVGEDGKPVTAEESLAGIEKFFGFKIREDFLPALGGEVALSFPLETFSRTFRMNREEEEERDAEPGVLVLVSLNDPETVRRLLPRALALFGVARLGAQPASETREGVEIRDAGGFAYAFMGNYLVAGELKTVRHAADSFAAHRTLASTNAFRDATAWQARQKLVQAYVSDALMRHNIDDTKKRAEGSTDPVVLALLAQLEVTPEAASLASTNEGDVVLHELRLPLSLIKAFSAATMIGVKEAPVFGNEMAATMTLNSLRSAQEIFRGKEGRERFGTLEELLAEDLVEKSEFERTEYSFELHALGDRFEATATPKNYGKTGRRSFFLDQTGVIRGADHKGKPATAQDPPID